MRGAFDKSLRKTTSSITSRIIKKTHKKTPMRQKRKKKPETEEEAAAPQQQPREQRQHPPASRGEHCGTLEINVGPGAKPEPGYSLRTPGLLQIAGPWPRKPVGKGRRARTSAHATTHRCTGSVLAPRGAFRRTKLAHYSLAGCIHAGGNGFSFFLCLLDCRKPALLLPRSRINLPRGFARINLPFLPP